MSSYESARLSCGEDFLHANYMKVKKGEMTFDELVQGSGLCDTKARSYIRMAKIPLDFKELCRLKESEKDYIRKNYEGMLVSEMAKKLKRSAGCVKDYLDSLEVQAKSGIIMNDEAIAELKEYGEIYTAKQWSEHFGVDITRIYAICREYNIEYKKGKNSMGEEEIEYINNNYKTMTPTELSNGIKKELGIDRSQATIRSYLEREELEIKKDNKKKENKVVEIKEIKKEVLKEVAVMGDSKEMNLLDIVNKYDGEGLKKLLLNLKVKLADEVLKAVNNSEYDKVESLIEEIKEIDKYIK